MIFKHDKKTAVPKKHRHIFYHIKLYYMAGTMIYLRFKTG